MGKILGFVIAICINLTLPHLVFGAAHSFGSSGRFRAPKMQRQHSFSRPFHRFGFLSLDGAGEQQVIIILQFQPASAVEYREPAKTRIYVPPRWVDGGYGVEVLEPGYWTDAKQGAER
jgi:hypothetical protein